MLLENLFPPIPSELVLTLARFFASLALDLVGSRADSKGVTIQVHRPTGRPRR